MFNPSRRTKLLTYTINMDDKDLDVIDALVKKRHHKIMNEAQNLNIALNFLRSDEPPLLVRCCYRFGLL